MNAMPIKIGSKTNEDKTNTKMCCECYNRYTHVHWFARSPIFKTF